MKKIKLIKKFLIKEYIKNKKSAYQIAEETSYGSSTIWRHLKRHNIKIRTLSEAHADVSGIKNPFFGKQHTKKAILKFRKRKRPDLSEINRQRIKEKNPRYNKERHIKYFCKETDCNNEITYQTWRDGLGFCNSCKLKGDRSSTYIDGRSYEPYPQEFTSSLKLKIRKRDDFTCQECGMTEEEHIIVYGRVLDIHHINYDKKNCREDNLISLCKQCNIRANYNRKYWEEHFKIKIKEKI